MWDLNGIEHDGKAFDEHAPLVEELLGRQPRRPLAPTSINTTPSADRTRERAT